MQNVSLFLLLLMIAIIKGPYNGEHIVSIEEAYNAVHSTPNRYLIYGQP